MYGDFVWWQGVVEDRVDPLKLGRCRVRVLGYHTDNKQKNIGIPTNELPWATPSQPITSAAMNGVGTTPLGPVEGTWVFGFFRDGKNAQEPVIIGTFGGIPEKVSDPTKGFNDPNGRYPLSTFLNEPDTNQLARGSGAEVVDELNGEQSPSLTKKRASRQLDVPVGVVGHLWDYDKDEGGIIIPDSGKGTIKHTDNTKLYDVAPWNEPNPRYGGVEASATEYLDTYEMSSQYPFNHVRMSESGHVEEWDDTAGSERLHRYHTSGTFEEIQPDGTKVTKIVGNEYEITAGYKDVWIKGSVNVTIGSKGDAENNKSDCRILYYGDLVQEVYGDYHLNVHGDMRTKISGNEAKEVLADRKIVVNGNDDLFVAKNQLINIGQDAEEKITGHLDQTVKKHVTATYGIGTTADTISHGGDGYTPPGNYTINVSGKTFFTSIGTYTLTSEADMKINTDSNLNINVKINCMIDIDGYRTEDVAKYSTLDIGEYSTVNIGQYSTLDIGQYLAEDIGSYGSRDFGGNYAVTASRIDLN